MIQDRLESQRRFSGLLFQLSAGPEVVRPALLLQRNQHARYGGVACPGLAGSAGSVFPPRG